MILTVIIPTMGRDTLERALASCEGADEILVIVDRSRAPEGWTVALPEHARLIEVETCNKGGHSSRNTAMPLATGTHLAFLDDDDVFLPGAIDAMRAAACDQPVVFRMDHPQHGILPRDREVRFGNVSTQMFLVPNDPARLGVWEAHAPELPQPGGDYTFIRGCVEKMGGPVWRDELVARLRPDQLSVAIVTPWFNHPELADDYLAAVSVRSLQDELIVVDNASDEPVPFAAVRLDDNRGFSGGSNAGLHAATTDIVVFLNNDIAATDPLWLERVRAAVQPGVLAGALLRHDLHGAVDGHPLPYLDGWCLAGMRADLLAIGGFDETFDEPAYYSDNDLCLRARADGMTLREVDTGLRHKGGRTSEPGVNAWAHTATRLNRERFQARARELLYAA